jgi:hypothetical protein
MKNHVLRPLWVAIAFVALILLARYILVPKDFGVQGKSFTYNFHRGSNTEEWKNMPAVKYRERETCVECHSDEGEAIKGSGHSIIQCENCHGPGKDHPETENPATMTIDRSRALCLRCHADLGYAAGGRTVIPPIDPEKHNGDKECVGCHNPHSLEMKEGVQ